MKLTIDEIINEYGAYLYRFALMLSGHPDSTEDIVQETFIKANTKIDQLANDEALKAWLRTICLNEFRMKARHHFNEDELSNQDEVLQDSSRFVHYDEDIVLDIVVSKEVADMRSGCFLAMSRKLTLPQRMAFSLCDMFGLSISEVASLLACSEGAVKGLLFRARLNLESFFSDHCIFMKENNACHCSSWIDFTQKRASMQKKMITSFHQDEYLKRRYSSQKEVRDKLLYYYHHMPVSTPSDTWYEHIIQVVNNSK